MTDAMALPPASLVKDFFTTPHGFDFSHAIDLLEHLGKKYLAMPEKVNLGSGTDPTAEVVRLTANFSLSFNGCAINYLEPAGDDNTENRPELSVNFFGLGGSDGPLPEPYIEMILRQLLNKDNTGADFLDIFQHRLLSFVYRSDNEFRIASPFKPSASSPFMPALRALLGRQSSNDSEILEPILAAHAGSIAQQRHSMSGFLTILRHYFKLPLHGREFAGRWIALPEELQTILGIQGRNDLLGEGAVLGQRAWDQNGAIEICIGPMSMPEFLDFLPGGTCHVTLQSICAFYLGPNIHCNTLLELHHLKPDYADLEFEYADLKPDGQKFQLGYNTWLNAGTLPVKAAERRVLLVFNDGYNADLPGNDLVDKEMRNEH